jgi:hypothetical protein
MKNKESDAIRISEEEKSMIQRKEDIQLKVCPSCGEKRLRILGSASPGPQIIVGHCQSCGTSIPVC